jgi:hypothetical protein
MPFPLRRQGATNAKFTPGDVNGKRGYALIWIFIL